MDVVAREVKRWANESPTRAAADPVAPGKPPPQVAAEATQDLILIPDPRPLASDVLMKIDHILVATDLSKEALACSAPVGGLARSMGARMTLLHVLEGHAAIPHGAPFAPPVAEPGPNGDAEEAGRLIEERRAAFGGGIEIHTEVLESGDVAASIIEYAQDHAADLIALATHGRTGFSHLALGSVAEAVVRRSTVPVLVLPRPKD